MHEDTEQDVCAGSHRIQVSVKQDHQQIPRVTPDPPAKRYSPLKQENMELFSKGPQH